MRLPYLRFLDLAGFNTNLDELDDVSMLTQLHYLNLDHIQLGVPPDPKLQGARFVVMFQGKQMFHDIIEQEVVNQVR